MEKKSGLSFLVGWSASMRQFGSTEALYLPLRSLSGKRVFCSAVNTERMCVWVVLALIPSTVKRDGNLWPARPDPTWPREFTWLLQRIDQALL